MIKYLLIMILTLFQDNFVRLGTILGIFYGFWSSEILKDDSTTNYFIFGFIGWGIGAYLAYYSEVKKSSKKLCFIKGGKK